MCGVFGFNISTPVTRSMVPVLAVYMEQRGHASWGVTDGRQITKYPSSIIDTFEEMNYSPACYHTRAASVGSVCEANAHPFESIVGQRRVIGVHNGHINNHDELDRKYHRDFDVDSMHIFQHIAEGLPVEEIEGWGNVIWLETRVDSNAPPTIFLSRFNSTDLHLVKLDTDEGELVWASTKKALDDAMRLSGVHPRAFYRIDERVKYSITADGRLQQHGPMNWSRSLHAQSAGACGYDLSRRNWSPVMRSSTGSLICAMAECHKMREPQAFVCEECFGKLFDKYVDEEILTTVGAC